MTQNILFQKPRGKIIEAKRKELRQKGKKALLTFLKQTREGKYVKIEKSYLHDYRVKE